MHAGDICDPAILDELSTIAPVTAVRGNNDLGEWAQALRDFETLEAGGVHVGVVHDVKSLDARRIARLHAIVAGHSHRPLCETREGVLWFNPGSAGPRRFSLPVSVGEIVVDRGALAGRIIELSV